MKLRPRFSLRTLAIFMTLVCAYFGAWEATKRYGIPLKPLSDTFAGSSQLELSSESSPFPFIIRHDNLIVFSQPAREYYLWLFGPRIKLPFN